MISHYCTPFSAQTSLINSDNKKSNFLTSSYQSEPDQDYSMVIKNEEFNCQSPIERENSENVFASTGKLSLMEQLTSASERVIFPLYLSKIFMIEFEL